MMLLRAKSLRSVKIEKAKGQIDNSAYLSFEQGMPELHRKMIGGMGLESL